jgi:hypothetical protein
MSQTREEFMAKWGIKSEEELTDTVTILQTLMKLQFQRLRPKWVQQFGEDVLKAVESMNYDWKGNGYVDFAG